LAVSCKVTLAKAKKRGLNGTGGAQEKALTAANTTASSPAAMRDAYRPKVSLLVALTVAAVFLVSLAASLEAVGVAADGSVAVGESVAATSAGNTDGEPESPQPQQPPHPTRQFDQLEETGEAIQRNHAVLASYAGPLLPYTLLETLPHDRAWFTQGLAHHAGYLWEGTGLYGKSKVHRVKVAPHAHAAVAAATDALKAAKAEVASSPALDKQYFGEGLAVVPARPGEPAILSGLSLLSLFVFFSLFSTFSRNGVGSCPHQNPPTRLGDRIPCICHRVVNGGGLGAP